MIVDKAVKEYSGANTVFSINSAGTAGQPHAKKKKRPAQTFYPLEKLIQSRSETQMKKTKYKTPGR